MNIRLKLHCNEKTFNLITALFFTAINGLFIFRTWQLIKPQYVADYLFAASVPLVLFSAFMALFSLFALPWIRKPIIVLLILVSASATYFIYSYGIVIDTNMVQNIVETRHQEALALVTPYYLLWLLIVGIIPAILLCRMHITPAYSWWVALTLRLVHALVSCVVILLIAAFFYKDYASLIRNNKAVVKLVTPANIVSGMSHYIQDHWFSGSQLLIRMGEEAKKGPLISQEQKKTLIIFVLGETARAENFSLGGYGRETNPELKQQHAIYYPHVTSCGTETAVSVPCMFSGMSRAHYDPRVAIHQEGLLDVLAHAGVTILWRDNDGGCKGVCDRIPHTDMTQWKLPAPLCQSESCLDDVLLFRLNHYIESLKNDAVIVLHQMGSHGPAYYQRYPETFRKFTPACDSNQIQNCNHQTLVNTYDNSLLYTDSMVSNTIELLKSYRSRFNVALIYLSDHGESLGEHGIYLHGTPYIIAPSQQTHIPFLLWLSPGYIKTFNIDKHCIRQHAPDTRLSQDNIFHTLLGMMNIITRQYKPQLDILTICRN
ncbi:phosphoethanolamine transferase EptA [Enterobacteriaceae bacterium LUAb1]